MTEPGVGPGWARLAEAVAGLLPASEVDGVWVFSPLRRDGKEWGTAVLSRVDGERRRIYTARYVLAVRGKERGKFEATLQEVGSGPVEALAKLLHDAQKRIDDEHPPLAVTPDRWFAPPASPPVPHDGSTR